MKLYQISKIKYQKCGAWRQDGDNQSGGTQWKKNGFTRSELLLVICILVGLGWLGQFNLSQAAAKARDFERKEQLKSTVNSLDLYWTDNNAFPPHGPGMTIAGCESKVCPIEDNEGDVCFWPTGIAVTDWRCGKRIYMTLPRQPDNPATPSEDTYRYVRLSPGRFVLESCLEMASDNEAVDIKNSVSGLDESICPSEVMYQIDRELK